MQKDKYRKRWYERGKGKSLGILDFFKGRKKNAAVDDDPGRHHDDPLDYLEERDKNVHCPECAKAQKHVHLVETEGEDLECPECHFLQTIRRG